MPGLHPGIAHLICLTRDHFVKSGINRTKTNPVAGVQGHKIYARSAARLNLSMRPSLMAAGTLKDPVGLRIEHLQPGQAVQG